MNARIFEQAFFDEQTACGIKLHFHGAAEEVADELPYFPEALVELTHFFVYFFPLVDGVENEVFFISPVHDKFIAGFLWHLLAQRGGQYKPSLAVKLAFKFAKE